MAGVTLIDLNGKAYTSDTNFSDRVYFSEAKKGNIYITEPFVSKLDGKMSFLWQLLSGKTVFPTPKLLL